MPYMLPRDLPRFQAVFAELMDFFRDPLSLGQQARYWLLLQDRITLAEWEYAAQQAMARETFYQVPLVAHFMDYVREYRQQGVPLVLTGGLD